MSNYQIGIYAITNRITGEMYVGQSKDVVRRLDFHIYQLRRRKHSNPRLQKNVDMYGLEAFDCTILEVMPDEIVNFTRWLNEKEAFYYEHFKPALCIGKPHVP